MNIFFTVFSFVLWSISIIGFGVNFRYILNDIGISTLKKEEKFLIFGLLGFILIYIIGVLLNFFIKLDYLFCSIISVIGIISFIINSKYIFKDFDEYDILILIFLLIYCSIIVINKRDNYDTGLYHLQTIKWIKENFLPFGLANLHYEMGYNQSWFIISALIEPYSFIFIWLRSFSFIKIFIF